MDEEERGQDALFTVANSQDFPGLRTITTAPDGVGQLAAVPTVEKAAGDDFAGWQRA
jgi:hypothetical protein